MIKRITRKQAPAPDNSHSLEPPKSKPEPLKYITIRLRPAFSVLMHQAVMTSGLTIKQIACMAVDVLTSEGLEGSNDFKPAALPLSATEIISLEIQAKNPRYSPLLNVPITQHQHVILTNAQDAGTKLSTLIRSAIEAQINKICYDCNKMWIDTKSHQKPPKAKKVILTLSVESVLRDEIVKQAKAENISISALASQILKDNLN